jgi:hypothetical protein
MDAARATTLTAADAASPSDADGSAANSRRAAETGVASAEMPDERPIDASTEAAASTGDAMTPALRVTQPEINDVFDQLGCDGANVLCLDLQGVPLRRLGDADAGAKKNPAARDSILIEPAVGDVVLIYVIGDPTFINKRILSCSVAGAAPRRAILTPPGAQDAGPADRYTLLGITFTVPDAPEFPITCRASKENSPDERFLEDLFTTTIKTRKDSPFHFEAGLLIPFAFGGNRTISRTPLAGTNEQSLHTVEDLEVSVSLAVHYFPLGIFGNGPWSAGPRGECASKHGANLLSSVCQYLLQPIGLEVGGRVDLSAWQVGLAFEPIRGGAISAGVSAVKGDFYRSGFRDGMIIGAQESLPVDRRYMFRPYIGVSISPEILRFLVDVFGQVQKLAPPAQSSPASARQ